MKKLYQDFLQRTDPAALMRETEALWQCEFGQTFEAYHKAADGINPPAVISKQIPPPFAGFIFRVFKAHRFQQGCQILLPEPRTVKHNAPDMIVIAACGNLIVPQDSQAQITQKCVFSKIWMICPA